MNVNENVTNYTEAELEAMTIHDLRIALRKMGGTPSLKNRSLLMNEIKEIQAGKFIPVRNAKGRKPKFIKQEAIEQRKAVEAQKLEADGAACETVKAEENQCRERSENATDCEVCRARSDVNANNAPDSAYVARRDNKCAQYGGQKPYGDRSYERRLDREPRRFDDRRNFSGGTYSGNSFSGTYASGTFAPSQAVVRDGDAPAEKVVVACGVLEIMDGFGFLRTYNIKEHNSDFYVDRQIMRKYGLRNGDLVVGYAVNKFDKTSLNVREIVKINDVPVEEFKRGASFDDLTAVYPDSRMIMETAADDYALRSIDLLAPIGKGQRGLIVAPPKTGKTTLLKKLANSVESNYPDSHLIVLLIDERPEEVTDFADCIKSGEVVCSTFDEAPEKHIKFAEIYLDRAKRLVEGGKDVVILLDSITKLARAYNNVIPSSGKTLSGGIDPTALVAPKKFFGAARNIRGGGSLTIISTALIETGSRMDDVIFEEFKGTGNMEIVLSRQLSERRVFPAIDLFKSGTRNEELLLTKEQLEGTYKIRKLLSQKDNASEVFLEMLSKTKNNSELLSRLDAWLKILNG